MLDAKNILVLAPHTDDGELGCGGTIAKFCAEGRRVYYASFCPCSQSLPPEFAPDTLEKECREATAVLGIPASQLIFFNYEVRNLRAFRQQVLDELVQLNRELKPELVLLPSASDIHQDHQVMHQEGLRAFKHTSIAGYELPWNNSVFNTAMFIRLSKDAISKKIAALKSYQSQASRNYMQEDFIRSLARVRGVQCNDEFAEAFEIYRIVT